MTINCNIDYIGKTKRHFGERTNEHLGISCLTGDPYKYNPGTATAVRVHLQECDYKASADDFEIIGSAELDWHLYIKESLLIKRDNPVINRSVQSSPLYLFN